MEDKELWVIFYHGLLVNGNTPYGAVEQADIALRQYKARWDKELASTEEGV